MFTSVLKHVSRLDSYQLRGNNFEIRFVAAFPSANTKDPVLTISLENCAKSDFEALIQVLDRNLVEGIDITNSAVEFQVDGAQQPVTIDAEATHNHDDYSSADLKSLAAAFEEQLNSRRADIRELNQRVKQVVGFIDDQIERSMRKAKKDESLRAATKLQIDLLRRIKSKLVGS